MRLLRILVLVLFVGCLCLNIWATAKYREGNNTVGPVITCDEEFLEISVEDGEDALMDGLTASDEQDGDLTESILLSSKSRFLEPGVFTAEYVVFDSHQNFFTITRKVRYTDYTAPVFRLKQPLVFVKGSNIRYLDYVRASDVLDGDISDKIKVIASDVSNYTTGMYPVLLEVANSYGDTVQIELVVVIEDGHGYGPAIALSEYLTYVKCGDSFDPYKLITSVTAKDDTRLDRNTVSVLGTVDTQTPGCYKLIYSCQYKGTEGKTYLTVVVTEEAAK